MGEYKKIMKNEIIIGSKRIIFDTTEELYRFEKIGK